MEMVRSSLGHHEGPLTTTSPQKNKKLLIPAEDIWGSERRLEQYFEHTRQTFAPPGPSWRKAVNKFW